MTYWRNSTYRLGLTGQISLHSLCYAFTQDQIDHYLKQSYSEQEAQAKMSMDLGMSMDEEDILSRCIEEHNR